MAPETPTIPISAVTVVSMTEKSVALMPRISGERTNTYGIMKAAMPSFDALTPVFKGSPPEIAEPAKAANATGGVISAMMPK